MRNTHPKRSTIILLVLSYFMTLPFSIKGKRITVNPYVMQEGVICRIDTDSGTATLVGVTEFSNHSFPGAVTSDNQSFPITRINPYCLWPLEPTSPDSITLPASIREIGERAFAGFPSLRHVNLPDSLEHIGEWAFANTGLERVTLPKSLKIIRRGTFEGCNQLSDVNLKHILYIEECAFKDCALRWVLLDEFNMLIGRDAFAGCNVFFLSFESPLFRNTLFDFDKNFGTRYIPWIELFTDSPYAYYMAFPKCMEGRADIHQFMDYKTIHAPVFISFDETGNMEYEWDSHNALWPLTDTLRTASRDDYVPFVTPVRIRIDTSVLPEEVRDTLRLKVMYNGEDITGCMRGDTVILSEGRSLNYPKDLGKYNYNSLEITTQK